MNARVEYPDISELVSTKIQERQYDIMETLDKGVPSRERYIEIQIEQLRSGRYGDTPNIHVRIKGISMFGYYKIGWDAAESGTDYEVPPTLYKWDKEVMAEIEKQGIEKESGIVEQIKDEAILQYAEGAADAWVYHWLKNGQVEKETEVENMSLNQRKPILQWNGNMNILATIFYDLVECGAITCVNRKGNGGANAEVSRMIAEYFLGEDGKPMAYDSVYNVLKPSGGKSRFRISKDNLKTYLRKG